MDVDDLDARQVKARAFRILGYAQINPTWRGFYLTAAGYLDGSLGELLDVAHQLAGPVRNSPDVLGQLPSRRDRRPAPGAAWRPSGSSSSS